MSTREAPESGLYTGRVEFVREATTGEIEVDPAYQFYSDNVTSVTHTPGLNISRRDGIGTPDATGHDKGNEQGEIEVVYYLQKQLVDGNGDPDDAAGDAWDRDADGRVKNTHQIRIRENRTASDPDDPTNADGCRVYIIGLGGHPDAELESDIESGEPLQTTITYSCEKVRQYEVFQPPGDESLEVASTDAGDTTQTLTIEDDTGTSEDVALNGTTAVTTTKADWASIRALELDAETDGDVTVSLATSSDTLATIRGANYHSQGGNPVEGDLGVPAVGAGTLATAVGSEYEYAKGATIQRGGSTFDYDVSQLLMAVENGWDPSARDGSVRSRWNEANRSATTEMDLIGWGVSPDHYDQALGGVTDDVTIELSNTLFTFGSAAVSEPGDTERGPEDAAIAYSVSFEPSDDAGITLSQVT